MIVDVCDRPSATEDPLGDLVAEYVFAATGITDGPSPIDVAVMQCATADAVPQILESYYDSAPGSAPPPRSGAGQPVA